VYADTSRINSTLRPWLCRFTYTYAFQPIPSHPRYPPSLSLSLSLILLRLLSFPPPPALRYIFARFAGVLKRIRAMARQVGNVSSWRDVPRKNIRSSENVTRQNVCGDVYPIVVLFLTCSINCCSALRRAAPRRHLPLSRESGTRGLL